MHIQLRHMIFEWDIEKNAKLQRERGVCFEDVERICKEGQQVHISKNFSTRYTNQYIIRVTFNNYIYRVPCIINGMICRLITIYPCRKDKYLLS